MTDRMFFELKFKNREKNYSRKSDDKGWYIIDM